MKIGVVSDTHSRPIPAQVLESFKSVDLIIHAGDFCSVEDFKKFQKVKTVKAVYGNMDEHQLREMLPERDIVALDNFKIGIYHGRGSANEILSSVQEQFQNEKVNAVIFGHSHRAFNEEINGVLYFNPGSPNDTIFAPYCSYGILEAREGKIVGKIIKVK